MMAACPHYSQAGCKGTDDSRLHAEIARLEADRAAQAERMARLEEALRGLRDAVGSAHADYPNIDRSDLRYFMILIDAALSARALSQEGSDA